MEIEKLRGYGIAASDAESGWDDAFKAKLKKTAQRIIMSHLSFSQKLKVLYWFMKEKKRAAKLDLSDLRSRGMNNEIFLKQQLEYISLFSALVKIRGKDDALKIMYAVMDGTAAEALLLSLPEVKDMKKAGDPFEVFRAFFAAYPHAARKTGCHDIRITENNEKVLQFDIQWCVWFELAKKMNVPEACIPNCYADDLAYPDYFNSLGIKYSRTGTLANGCKICDFRFEKINDNSEPMK